MEHESLIVFDEVQMFSLARGLLKYLVADGRYDYIETGSLLSIKQSIESIVIPSEETAIELNPLDFEEFLWAMGERKLSELIRMHFEELHPLPDGLHRRAERLFREYMLVGGMPHPVSIYVENRNVELYKNAANKPRVSPIEVKSPRQYATSSLNKFKEKFKKRIGTEYVLHPKQLRIDGDRYYLPLYMGFCLLIKDSLTCGISLLPAKYDLSFHHNVSLSCH